MRTPYTQFVQRYIITIIISPITIIFRTSVVSEFERSIFDSRYTPSVYALSVARKLYYLCVDCFVFQLKTHVSTVVLLISPENCLISFSSIATFCFLLRFRLCTPLGKQNSLEIFFTSRCSALGEHTFHVF